MSLFSEIKKEFHSKNIVVIGDIILDHYIWGVVDRISPEAPIPVLDVKSETFRLGGALNVVANICSLGGQARVIGIVGQDENAVVIRKMLNEIGADANGLIVEDNRPTTIKTRVIAHHQQIVRIDREVKGAISDDCKLKIVHLAETAIPKSDAVIVSDYDKGVISPFVLESVIARAKENGKPVIVDPKVRNTWNYKGATAITPNLKEAGIAFGQEITDENSLISAGKTILEKLDLSAVLITRGEHGMTLFQRSDGSVTHIPAVAKEVFDVTGAGDTVIAVFTLGLTAGMSMVESARLSNYAAGIVVGKVGTSTVTPEELISVLDENHEL